MSESLEEVAGQLDKRLEIIQDLAVRLLHEDSIDAVLISVVAGAIERLGFEDCIIYLWNDQRQVLEPKATYGGVGGQQRDIEKLPELAPGQGIVGTVYREQRPIRLSDTSTDPRYYYFDVHGNSELTVPIIYEGRTIGVIDSEHHSFDYFRKEHEELLTLVASIAAPKIGNLQTIDRLQRTQSALERSRGFIREIIDTAPNVLYVLDYDRKLMIEGMDKFAEFFGFSTEEIEAMEDGVYSLIHPDDIDSVAAQEKELAEAPEGAVVPVEFRLRDSGGNYRWCLISSKIFKRDESGAPKMEIGSVMDISSLKAAELALQQRERQLRAMFENCFDCIVLYDRFAICQYTTPSIKRFMGFEDHEVVGHSALDFVVEEDHAASNRLWFDLVGRPGGHAIIEQRIRHKDGREIWIEARLTNHLDDPDVNGIVSNFHDISERKAAEARIHQLANYDSLTGLPNRRLLMERLQRALQRAKSSESSLILMYMDLDRFKNVNDTLGHDVGDRLLISVAEAAREVVGTRHTLARLGGDEFAVVLTGAPLAEGRRIARQLVRTLERPFEVGDYEIRLTGSVGVARYPEHGTEVDELFKHADIAMYRAKNHRNRYAIFRAQDARAMQARVALEKDLQQALENERFELWYQPRIELDSGRVVSVEALLRWDDGRRGMMLPGRFIPVAEETGLIYKIGEWVLNATCRQARAWRDQGHTLGVSMNLSARELMRRDIVAQVEASLSRHGLTGDAIELEITETAAMTDLDYSMRVLHELRDLGVKLAIDDFGTGHSSLSYLRELPVDCLKIDQSFLPGPGPASRIDAQHSIITGIVLLAESVGLMAVAEGVETAEQHQFLKDVGCDQAQGYYYGEPVAPDELKKKYLSP